MNNTLYTSDITQDHKKILYGMAITQKSRFAKTKIHNGHEIFEMIIETGEVRKADYSIEKIHDRGKDYKVYKLKQKLTNIYLTSLNLDNALKKFNKILYTVKFIDTINKKSAPNHVADASLSLQGGLEQDANKSNNNTENADTVHS